MAAYLIFTSLRSTTPDFATLVANIQSAANDPTAYVVSQGDGVYRVKKANAFTGPEIAAVQTAIDAAPAVDPAVQDVDQKVLKAIVMGLWEAIPAPTMTKVQLRNRILQIYRAL